MTNLIVILLGALASLYACNGYKLLLVFPIPSKSHGILGDNMVKHLLEAGHDITYITPYINREAHPRLKLVDVSATMKFFNAENSLNVKDIMDKKMNLQSSEFMTNLLIDIATLTLENENLQKFIRDPNQKFDAVIGEWMFSDLYATFAAVFDCPFIWFSTVQPHWIILNLVDGPLNPAYSSDYQNDHVPPLSLYERAYELWTIVTGLYRQNLKFYSKEEAVYQRLIAPALKEKSRVIPSYDTLRYNASLVLGNSHVVFGNAVSLPQSYKHIGGYHIDEEVKPLPENLKKIMDNAEHGVIYFSMGSNLKSKDLPMELKSAILKVLGSLKQTVLWKFEEVLPDTPNNVHMLQWAPQQSILAHPKVVLFVTHGGLLSVTEAIHFGVPVISIPVFADQFLNSAMVEKKGLGKKVELSYTMHKDIKIAIDEILGNPKYSAKAKDLSLAYHDQPMKPKQVLTHWIGHVIRTKGAPHLRSPALQLYLYQRLYLDLLVITLVLLYILKCIVLYIIKLVLSINISKWNKKPKQL